MFICFFVVCSDFHIVQMLWVSRKCNFRSKDQFTIVPKRLDVRSLELHRLLRFSDVPDCSLLLYFQISDSSHDQRFKCSIRLLLLVAESVQMHRCSECSRFAKQIRCSRLALFVTQTKIPTFHMFIIRACMYCYRYSLVFKPSVLMMIHI